MGKGEIMKSYIFITVEGSTYQPESELVESDIENCQVIGFGYGADEVEAFDNMLEENQDLLETTFDEVICMELRHSDYHKYSEYFSLEKRRQTKTGRKKDEYIRKARFLTEEEQNGLIDDCQICYYCREPFKECDTMIPGFGVVEIVY